MSIKDTLTNNSMNSFSFGGKTYTRRVDNGAVVYDISAGTDGSAFSTGWVDQDASGTDVANGANLTFVHNLGTTDIVTSAFVNSTASDTDAQQIPVHEVGTYNHGYAIVDMDANSITVNLADDGYFDVNSSGGGTYTSLATKFFKLVIVAKMGSGGGGGTPAGSDRQLQFNDNGTFGANANLKFDGSTAFLPRLAVGEGNASGDEGGEITLKQSVTNNTLVGDWVYMDIWQNRIRFFEDGAPYKGAYIDLSACADGVGTNLLAGGSGGGGGSYGTTVVNAATEQFFYSDAGHTTAVNLTNATDGARFYNKDKFILVHLVYSASSNQSATLDVTYYPPGSSTGYIVGATRKGGGSGHAYQQNITFAMAPGSSWQVDNTSFVQRAATVMVGSSAGSSGGGANVTTSPDVPASGSDGDLWYDEDGAALYVYTDSIGGWIQANGGGGGGTGPRAYVVFDGRSSDLTGSITSSLNVSSIEDKGVGQYEVNLTSSISNPLLVSSPIGHHRQSYNDIVWHETHAIALPYGPNGNGVTGGLGATTTSKIWVESNQPQTGGSQDAPVHLLVF